jgi:hypothetical protein
MLIVTAYVALAVWLNSGSPTLYHIGKGDYRVTRGFPFDYLDVISNISTLRNYCSESELESASLGGAPSGLPWAQNKLPFVTNWAKFAANIILYVLLFWGLQLAVPRAVRSTFAVVRSLFQSRKQGLRSAMIPAAVLGFFGAYCVFWGTRATIKLCHLWLNEHLGDWSGMVNNMAGLVDLFRPAFAIVAGVGLLVAARTWVEAGKRKFLATFAALCLAAIVCAQNIDEWKAGRVDQFIWPIQTHFDETAYDL